MISDDKRREFAFWDTFPEEPEKVRLPKNGGTIIPLDYPDKEPIHIPISETFPSGLRDAIKRLEACFNTEDIWHPDEIGAAEVLFGRDELVPVWCHLSKFVGPNDWFRFIVEVFLEPFAYKDLKKNQKIRAKQLSKWCQSISEKAYELRVLLSYIDSNLYQSMPEVEVLVEDEELDRVLLKLISLTTSCQWPTKEYQYLYENGSVRDVDDCKNAETYYSYKESSKKKDDIIEVDGKGYEFQRKVFMRNLKYENRYKYDPPYDFQADHCKAVLIKKDNKMPPLFEPVQSECLGFSDSQPYTRHMGFLTNMLSRLDSCPVCSGNAASRQPLKLDSSMCQSILAALFPNQKIDLRQIKKVLKNY